MGPKNTELLTRRPVFKTGLLFGPLFWFVTCFPQLCYVVSVCILLSLHAYF